MPGYIPIEGRGPGCHRAGGDAAGSGPVAIKAVGWKITEHTPWMGPSVGVQDGRTG
jgi:hypothetical protein